MAETQSPFDDNKSLAKNSDQKNPFVCFFFNLFEAIKLPFLPKNIAKIEPAEPIKVQPLEPIKIDPAEPIIIQPVLCEDENDNGVTISYPRQNFIPPKLQAEAEVAVTKTNPVILWQVYAIGGFFVLRWAWTKWNERKGQKKSDDEPPPSRD